MPIDDDRQELRKMRAARARAARAYADMKQDAVAEALGVSHITVKRMERGAKDITMDELWAIADACGVPRSFMDSGFETVPEELRSIHARFDRLETALGMSVAEAIAGRALDILREDDASNGDG
jgi:transcriptional regulator with XRE-family HTH domain